MALCKESQKALKRSRGSALVLARTWQCRARLAIKCPTLDVSPQREGRWVLVEGKTGQEIPTQRAHGRAPEHRRWLVTRCQHSERREELG